LTNIKAARSRAPTPVYKTGHPWDRDPRASFKDWLASADDDGRGFGEGTIKVYAAMWSTFVRHVETQLGRSATMARADDVAHFLDHAAACRREQGRRRYQLLLDRAFRAMAEAGPIHWTPSPAAPRTTAKAADKPMPFLSRPERDQVFAALAEPSDFHDEEGWMRARAKALCALMLGAGFKPGQANHASVNCVEDGPLRFVVAPALGAIAEHRALVKPQAWPAIQSWLDAGVSGDGPMFPGRGGAAAGPVGYARAFVGAKELLRGLGQLAGGERASPQTLRNSYGASLIEDGHGLAAVREYMGFSRLEFARRFAEAHAAWVARMARTGTDGGAEDKDKE
jgi:site-specific recombinase XerD